MPRYCNVNFSGYCIPDMLKQLHPHTGGLRWLGVLYVISVTHALLGCETVNWRCSRFGIITAGLPADARFMRNPPWALIPFSRIRRATRCLLQVSPASRRSRKNAWRAVNTMTAHKRCAD